MSLPGRASGFSMGDGDRSGADHYEEPVRVKISAGATTRLAIISRPWRVSFMRGSSHVVAGVSSPGRFGLSVGGFVVRAGVTLTQQGSQLPALCALPPLPAASPVEWCQEFPTVVVSPAGRDRDRIELAESRQLVGGLAATSTSVAGQVAVSQA